jgi:single-strand DNA-binding protein
VSRSLNKVMLIGNLGSDPEIRTTGGGTKVAQFSLATSRSWKSASGEQQEKTEWHRIVAWERLAEIVERFLHKGSRVYVEGEIEYRSYEAKDGSGTKYTTEIRARDMMMLDGREGGAGGGGFEREASAPRARSGTAGGGGGRGAAPAGGGYDGYEAPAFEDDDDLPF